MYGSDHFFVLNKLDRFAIGDRDPLKSGADGSLSILIQQESPGAELESNWLPAPADDFNLIMRIYWPKPEVLDGRWTIPAVKPQ